MNETVLYLPSADSEHQALLERWTARRGATLILLRDAYAMCVHLLRTIRQQPACVFIELDALLADELEVFSCLSAACPDSQLFALGGNSNQVPDEARRHVRALTSSEALRKWIEAQPSSDRAAAASPSTVEGS